MNAVDVADDTYIDAPPAAVASVVADPRRWAQWWPDLVLSTSRDRGLQGRQWTVGGALAGTTEIWLEPWWSGVLVHYYLRADPAASEPPLGGGRAASRRSRATERDRVARAQAWKEHVHRLKDELEARGRASGTSNTGRGGAAWRDGVAGAGEGAGRATGAGYAAGDGPTGAGGGATGAGEAAMRGTRTAGRVG